MRSRLNSKLHKLTELIETKPEKPVSLLTKKVKPAVKKIRAAHSKAAEKK
jgi:hypothetical protein